MTREEATEILKAYRNKLSNSVSNQLDGDIKAFDMAIESLEQEPCKDSYKQGWHDAIMHCHFERLRLHILKATGK